MKHLVAPLVVMLTLAGCAGTPIPEHAAVDTHEAVPEATLYGWLEPRNGSTEIVGRFDYDGIDLLRVDWVQPHGYWNLTILDEAGEEILYDDRPSRKDWDEVLQGPFHEEFHFTWFHTEYDRYQRAGTYDDIPSQPVPNGTYTVLLDFLVWGQPVGAFRVEMTLEV